MRNHFARRAAGALVGLFALPALAQPNDGQWHGTLGAGLSLSSGNTESSSVAANGEATRATDEDRWLFAGKALSARTDGVQSGEQWKLGGRYEPRLGLQTFGTLALDLEHDRIAQLSLRVSPSVGVGYRVYDFDDLKFNVSTGIAYVNERYTVPRLVDDEERSSDEYVTVFFSEDSAHKLSPTLSAHQRLVITPNPDQGGKFRADFDSGLAMALTAKLALNVGLTVRYDGAAAPGLRKTDSLLITGLALKFD